MRSTAAGPRLGGRDRLIPCLILLPCYLCVPFLTNIENTTHTYFFGKYPPKNVASRVSRTLEVIEPSGLDIEFAKVVMYNTTAQDYLEVSPARLAVLDLDTEFYPGDGSAHLYIWGTRTASAYQVALQYVRYRAPWSYGPRHQAPGWRNVTFQVVNTAAETSNVIERAVWIEGADKILDESWTAYVSDNGGMQVWLQEISS